MSASTFLDTLRKHELSQVNLHRFALVDEEWLTLYLSLNSFILRKQTTLLSQVECYEPLE